MENQYVIIVAENSPWVLLGSHKALELEPKQLYISGPPLFICLQDPGFISFKLKNITMMTLLTANR